MGMLLAILWGLVTITIVYFAVFTPIVLFGVMVEWLCDAYTRWEAKRRR